MKLPRFFGRSRASKALAAYQRELVDTHYREVENMYRQMRIWRHDYRNHIQTLKVLAANGDIAAIRSYLDGLDAELKELDTPIKSGNAMADAILNSKVSLAKAHGIDARVDARIPIKLRISELDLCCVLGNLFDNAIEANEALPESERMIRVYMDMKGPQLYISFTNAAPAGKRRKKGGLFPTTKKGEGHGFGLVHIDRIVEDAGGYLSRNSESGAFTTEILLPQA
ncbi:sensor histidine kinase [Bifidobacterium vespertilionis]|uniref:ATP-binding protein n=1 Tax=Bifidobacterium vespertilionis TaxID=2562524 RepID=A0A5J5DVF5_9BIFI|nr:ATP-binding protein [Bifidobacterium vespertilionis]KAA8820791.1 ATP-binding protein [Bifidobacterium vespertilionis]KAA8822260.1 ATP-binding protein [Bifidobacterium vespertilionis]